MVKAQFALCFDTFQEFEAACAVLRKEFGPELLPPSPIANPSAIDLPPAHSNPDTGERLTVAYPEELFSTPLELPAGASTVAGTFPSPFAQPEQLTLPGTAPSPGAPMSQWSEWSAASEAGRGENGAAESGQTGEKSPIPPLSAGPATDASGAEYNPEIHASPASKTQKGLWKKRRGKAKGKEDTGSEIGVPFYKAQFDAAVLNAWSAAISELAQQKGIAL